MKKFLRISWGANSTPLHLLGAAVLAFLVMLYINTVIGGLGGFPAFLAYAIMFFLVRSVQNSGNRISHFVAITSKREILYLFTSYTEGYVLFYVLTRIIQGFTRISGWGKVQGMGLDEYIGQLYGTTLMERWAYIFAFIFMMAFVLSLFPLITFRRTRNWLIYAVCDVILHTIFSTLVTLSCLPRIAQTFRGKVRCLLDALLLCKMDKPIEVIAYLIVAVCYLSAAIFISLKVANYSYSPRPGAPVKNPENYVTLSTSEIEQKRKKHRRKNRNIGIALGIVIAFVGTAFVYVFFIQPDSEVRFRKVGESMTEDTGFGPMHYGTTVYIPVDEELDFYETGSALGYLGAKGENCGSRYYRLAIANVLYHSADGADLHLQQYGMTEEHAFLPASLIEEENAWEKDEIFLLWDEDRQSESAYTEEGTGYAVCPRELVEALELQFGVVEYEIGDFYQYDSYFTLSGYANLKDAILDGAYPGDWVGCILVKDKHFYYGNFDNEITGQTLELLRTVLGGA